MLTQFKVDNFKSLIDFSLPNDSERLSGFVCLIGLNGAGKSSVLQAIDFVANLVVGDTGKWLASRGWEKSDLLAKGSKKRSITFLMKFEVEGLGELEWSGTYNNLQGRCTREELVFTPSSSVSVDDPWPSEPTTISSEAGLIKDSSGWRQELTSEHSGSVFNKLRIPSLGMSGKSRVLVYLIRYFTRGVKSLELLSPHSMRKSSKGAVDVGLGGEALAAFIHGMSNSEKGKLLTELATFYPRVKSFSARAGKYGWKRLFVSEKFNSLNELDARHINDGMLRVAAIIAQTVASIPRGNDLDHKNPDQREYQVVLLDEIENGMNPEVIERLVGYLIGVHQQVFVTTHSPLILNFLPDDVARESVFLIFKSANGESRSTRFFDVPEVSKRLELMGPGEAFLDVRLEKLSSALAHETGG